MKPVISIIYRGIKSLSKIVVTAIHGEMTSILNVSLPRLRLK